MTRPGACPLGTDNGDVMARTPKGPTLPPPEKTFFVRNDDHVDGPHPVSRIKAWLLEGRLPPTVLLSPDGQTWHRVKAPHPGPKRT